jgi:hypothetical protein
LSSRFSNKYQISQLEEATTFNGIEIIRDLNNPHVIKLSQEFQIKKFLDENNSENYKEQEYAEQDMQFVLAEESNMTHLLRVPLRVILLTVVALVRSVRAVVGILGVPRGRHRFVVTFALRSMHRDFARGTTDES